MPVKPPTQPSDPRLIEAAAEIKKVLQRYDIMGVVALANGLGHGEFVNWLTGPTWSAISLERRAEDDALVMRFKVQGLSATAERRLLERLKTQKTVNGLVIMSDIMRGQSARLDYFREHLAQHIDWEESEGRMTPATTE